MSEHKDTPLIISFSTLFECYFIRKEKDSKIKKVEERHARYCGIDFFIELLSMMELKISKQDHQTIVTETSKENVFEALSGKSYLQTLEEIEKNKFTLKGHPNAKIYSSQRDSYGKTHHTVHVEHIDKPLITHYSRCDWTTGKKAVIYTLDRPIIQGGWIKIRNKDFIPQMLTYPPACLMNKAGKGKRFRIDLGYKHIDILTSHALKVESVCNWVKQWSSNAKLITASNKIIDLSSYDVENKIKKQSCYFVYFISNNTAIKIGIAKDVARRLSSLQTSSHEKLTLLKTISVNTEREARKLEAELHKKFETFRLSGEWFESNSILLDYTLNERE